MPELPEVETVRRDVLPKVRGRTVRRVELADRRILKGYSAPKFIKGLTGQKIIDLERRAKYLLFKLASGKYFVVHLGMTGRLLFAPDKYVKAIFTLSDGKKLYYSDLRLFGRLKLFDRYPELKLGPEPLGNEFTPELFKSMLAKRKGPIRSVLLDQKMLAGLGNIYVLESLFAAGIRPDRKANSLKTDEVKKLHSEIRKVLIKSLGLRGTSFNWYVDAKGKKGSFQLNLMVYGRKGEPCPVCGTPIKRTNIGQRGTYYCPRCQK
ncbi:MAG TPA: bifunctional DNA-formamidopyrimidine glycosylase/DNA-(apurinic or apyrimidinic site) lyase [Candidatus Omnitrophota bacterium]|nr:bifunctional DNA-formamidopyrimidine glycosylase/DNA-(apurinic or apyrimidinic site) lyase [Candidatus Omnitrophota bacterium]